MKNANYCSGPHNNFDYVIQLFGILSSPAIFSQYFLKPMTMSYQNLVKMLNNGKQIDLILLDFSKAFDKVNHQIMLKIE